MSDPNPIDDFVQMSALLTGFAADTIAPPLDPVDLKRTLFEAAQKGAGAAFDELLALYAQLSGGTPVSEMSPEQRQSIGEQLLDPGSDPASQKRAATAQSVMRLWYLGYWYPIEAGAFESVVSDQAYIRGLAWQVMQSHAMGYSPWTYGYWTKEPPPADRLHRQPGAVARRRRGGGAVRAAAGALDAGPGQGRPERVGLRGGARGRPGRLDAGWSRRGG